MQMLLVGIEAYLFKVAKSFMVKRGYSVIPRGRSVLILEHNSIAEKLSDDPHSHVYKVYFSLKPEIQLRTGSQAFIVAPPLTR